MDPHMTPQPHLNMASAPPPMPQKKSSPVGSIVGAIIVIIIIIFGGLYFWGAALEKQQNQQQFPYIPDDGSAQSGASVPGIPTTSHSDNISDIAADVSATNMNQFSSQVSSDAQAIQKQF